ncbi:zinc finger, CCHC-type containing protein [Tanacetum coccineum]|uniref:Zinc finger, CCHC-type containing protein n=1 Tax=Tanacetum coccineum TaxID=301880 RepID=A0ABQ5EEK3_9ASTR
MIEIMNTTMEMIDEEVVIRHEEEAKEDSQEIVRMKIVMIEEGETLGSKLPYRTLVEIECYNCHEFGHYAANCPKPDCREEKANLVFEDDEPALLMVTSKDEKEITSLKEEKRRNEIVIEYDMLQELITPREEELTMANAETSRGRLQISEGKQMRKERKVESKGVDENDVLVMFDGTNSERSSPSHFWSEVVLEDEPQSRRKCSVALNGCADVVAVKIRSKQKSAGKMKKLNMV